MTSLQNDLGPAFPLGQIIVAPAARDLLPRIELLDALLRHVCPRSSSIPENNGQFLFPFTLESQPVISAYLTSVDRTLVIITEADRSRTIFILRK